MKNAPTLWMIVPCYNEQEVLPVTAPLFLEQLQNMYHHNKISDSSRILFVDDGSKDDTWEIIRSLSEKDEHYLGICQSRNRGQQNAILAGLMEAKDRCDITVSIDCDGQDDIGAMERMVDEYLNGSEIVYGIRSIRKTDGWFKRMTAQGYYKLLNRMGAEIVFNHSDYRLVSSRVLQYFAEYKEVNVFLRGMCPLVGFKSIAVYYERHERLAGKSHYSLKKMFSLAFDGITSLSTKPIALIMGFGFIASILSFIGIIWAIVMEITGHTVVGWASVTCVVCFLGGIQLLSLGIIGEYVGKIYMETKHRPRYIISERTYDKDGR